MSALHLKKGASKHSAYNLRPQFSDVQEKHTLALLVEGLIVGRDTQVGDGAVRVPEATTAIGAFDPADLDIDGQAEVFIAALAENGYGPRGVVSVVEPGVALKDAVPISFVSVPASPSAN